MAEAAISFLLEKISRLWDAPEEDDELQRVEDELANLKAILREMESNTAERWSELDLRKRMKELVYDVQDIHESWQIQVARNTTICLSDKKVVYGLRREMISIRKYRLEPILRIVRAYLDLEGQQEQPTKPNQVHLVQLNKEISVKKIVGFEDEANALITRLMQKPEELDVICITGMPGIGKTTLALKVYQSETIKRKFAARIWVDIPRNFSTRELYLNILREFFKQDMVDYNELVSVLDIAHMSYNRDLFLEFLTEFDIMYVVQTCLESWGFLLVMDAVWTADSLKSVMDLQLRMGKVLITTCNNSVCMHTRVERKPHVLRFLTEKESWELLQLEVFGKLGECPETLKPIGECISKNCDGLPLAIVAVGARLRVPSYLNEQWWRKVSQNVMVYLADYDNQHVYTSIELSYNKLTQHSQDCFLYLGVFPQGHEIPVRTVTRLWSAERLVQNSRSPTGEDSADQTLHDLIDKSMVIAGKFYPNGQIKTVRLHKLLYGFCKYKAAEQEFYHEIRMSGGGDVDHLISLPPNHRRLCVYSHFSEFFSSAAQEQRQVRSILCLRKEDKVVVHPKDSSTIHKYYKSLRVLECRCVSFSSKFPKKLSKMILLRYISLSCDDLAVIPESISSLRYLETLVVDTQSSSITLKANIWKMLRLQHLVTKAAIVLAIRGEGEAGANLQTLSRLAPESCTEDVFRRAPNLTTLGIRGRIPDSDSQLHCLRLRQNLKRLTLSGTYLKWECMDILGKISQLEILKLKNNAFTGESWKSTDADCFLRLGFLLIATTDLVCWEAPPSCFPNLKHLVLIDCEKLDKIPSTLAKSLEKVNVDKVSESAAASAREIEQEIARRQGQNKMQWCDSS